MVELEEQKKPVMMKRAVLLLLSFLLIFSCEKRDCTRKGMVQIDEAIIPGTVLFNDVAHIEVRASAPDGCWSNLYVVLEETEPFSYSLKAYGTFTCCYDVCACPAIMIRHDTIIDFTPAQKGTYYFHVTHFWDDVDIDTMIVR
jgi:hypothetical protein